MSIRSSQRDIAALLAIEAYRLADTPRTRSALLSTFTADVGYLGTDRLSEAMGEIHGAVLADGQTALVAGDDQQIHSYNLGTGAVGEAWAALADLDPNGASRFFSSADSRLVAQVYTHFPDRASIVGVFDTTTRHPVMGPIKAPVPIDNAVFSPDGRRLYVSGGTDGTVIAYSIVDGREVGRLAGVQPPADSFLESTTAGLAFVAGGLLAVGSVGGPVRLVDPRTLAVRSTFDAPRGTTERFFSIDNGKTLIGSGVAGRVRVDLANASRGPTWVVGTSDGVTLKCEGFAVAEKLRRFYCADPFGRLEERDLDTGGFVREMGAQNGQTGSVWLARDQTELVSFGENEPVVAIWRLDGSGPISRRIGQGVSPYAYSPDGVFLLTGIGSDQFSDPPDKFPVSRRPGVDWSVLDAETGTSVIDSTGALTFPDWLTGSSLLGQTGGTPGLATLDLGAGTMQQSGIALPRAPEGLALSKHRMWLYYSSDGAPYGPGPGEIWTIDLDASTRIEPTIRTNGFFGVSGSDSGDRVSVASYFGATVVDGITGKLLHTFSEPFADAGWVIPGHRVITTNPAGDMIVYDLDTFRPLVPLGGARGEVAGIQSSADGSLVATVGQDRRVILYDVVSGTQIGDPITIPDAELPRSALRLDGKELAIGGGPNSSFVVWDLDPERWVAAACKIAGRNLTKQEFDANIGNLAPYHVTCPELDLAAD